MRYNGGMKSAFLLSVLAVAPLGVTILPAQEHPAQASDDLPAAARAAFAKWEASDLSDRRLLETAVEAILRAGAPAIADLGARATAVAAEKPADRRKVEALDAAVTHLAIGYLKRESEAEMLYEGQYAPLRALQPYVGKLYLDLLLKTPDWYDQGNRHVLVAPLRDIFLASPGADVVAALREIATDEDFEPEPLRQNLAFALAQWGDPSLIEARIARVEKNLADETIGRDQRAALRYELADIHYTLRAYPRAARIHVELLREAEAADVPLLPNHYYNAACALARAGQPDAAFDELARAVARQTGSPIDPSQKLERKLFEQDHDLDTLRGDPRFGALVEKAFGPTKSTGAGKG